MPISKDDVSLFEAGDEVLLVPLTKKTIPANTSILVGHHLELGDTIDLQIDDGANLTVTG